MKLLLPLLQVPIKDMNNIYANWSAIGVLILLLVAYFWYTFRENIRRDKQMVQERKDMIENHKQEKEEMRKQHCAEMEQERQRYHEIHTEIMTYLKLYTHKHEN